MDTRDAVTPLGLELSEEQLLTVEHLLPSVEHDLEEHAELVRDRYDEQIYAALVAPSF